jgi:hypothetical protein
MAPPNEHQLTLIIEVKSVVEKQTKKNAATSAVPLIHRPQRQMSLYQKVSPKQDGYYRRPVIALVPDLNFIGLVMLCPSCGQNKLQRHGWADITSKRKRSTDAGNGPLGTYRYIHGLYEGWYLLQARYICEDKKNCKATTTAYKWLESPVCPDHVRLALKIFTLSNQSGLMQEVMDMLMTDAMSPKSFEDIELYIKTMRNTKYLRDRASYYASVAEFVKIHGTVTIEKFQEGGKFSAIDDSRGYNEELGPCAGYLIDFFKGKDSFVSCYSSPAIALRFDLLFASNYSLPLFSTICDSAFLTL